MMQRIQVQNCGKVMCCNLYCSKRATYVDYLTLNSMKVVLMLCEKHANDYNENWGVGQ